MTAKSQPGIEKELAQQMWMYGYLPVRCASQTVDGAPEPDMVFMKNGHTVMVKVVHLKAGSSKKTVIQEAAELKDMRGRAASYSINADAGVHTGFAVKKGMSEEWYWADNDTDSVLYKEDHDLLRESLPV